jgi:ribosomal-protein-alanine N-acetyltransferase
MIRSFAKRDLPHLYLLDQVCFPPEIAYSRAELQYFLTHPGCSCWVVEDTPSSITGFLILERVRHAGRLSGHIVTLDVDPGHRRQGVGALLMQTAEEQMKQEMASHIRLEVAQNNPGAQQFYARLGFHVSGTIAKYYGGRIDADVMEKAIASLTP